MIKNDLASKSDLYIYSDAPKNSTEIESVNEVRSLIEQVAGFNKVKVIKQESNKGLASSIISGVSEVVNLYGKVIVLEDDLVTSPSFLTFMNNALDKYELEEKVWHISGWNYPIETKGLGDVFFWRTMNCWGWATWANRWESYDKNPSDVIDKFTKKSIREFNLSGKEDFWSQIIANKNGKINTWAIFWYATIFQNKGLCLNPTTTFVSNIGLDGSGENCGVNENYFSTLNEKKNLSFDVVVKENKLALERIKDFYKSIRKPFFVRVVNWLYKRVFGKIVSQ